MIIPVKLGNDKVQRCLALVDKLKPIVDESLIGLLSSAPSIAGPMKLRLNACFVSQIAYLGLYFMYSVPADRKTARDHVGAVFAAAIAKE